LSRISPRDGPVAIKSSNGVIVNGSSRRRFRAARNGGEIVSVR
jgi:hypothetical protein